jgi:outer membrane protein
LNLIDKQELMKKLLTLALAMATLSVTTMAQRIAYVDTDYILEKIPEYKDAQTQLDDIAAQWRAEIDKDKQEIEQLYKRYQAEQYLMDDQTRAKKEDEISGKEKAVHDKQQSKFGYEGELFKKRQELVKPIQDKVYNAVVELAKTRGYDFIFDKASGGPYMLYADPKNDKSDEILKALGY